MEKVNLNIEGFEDKMAKSGKQYTRFLTSDGWMSCFEEPTIASLKEQKGKAVSVTVATSTQNDKTYKNIRAFHGQAEAQPEPYTAGTRTTLPVSTPCTNNKNGSMYASYAKDIFVAINENGLSRIRNRSAIAADTTSEQIMAEAILLVKQAKEAI